MVQVELSGSGEGLNICISNMSQVRETWLLLFCLKNPLQSQVLCEGFRLEQTLDLKQVASAARTGGVLPLPRRRGFLASEVPAEDSLGSG